MQHVQMCKSVAHLVAVRFVSIRWMLQVSCVYLIDIISIDCIHLHAAVDQLISSGSVTLNGYHRPLCDSRSGMLSKIWTQNDSLFKGLYTSTQCDTSGRCWCVDTVTGIEFYGTRSLRVSNSLFNACARKLLERFDNLDLIYSFFQTGDHVWYRVQIEQHHVHLDSKRIMTVVQKMPNADAWIDAIQSIVHTGKCVCCDRLHVSIRLVFQYRHVCLILISRYYMLAFRCTESMRCKWTETGSRTAYLYTVYMHRITIAHMSIGVLLCRLW
jgi:hypothetical protein